MFHQLLFLMCTSNVHIKCAHLSNVRLFLCTDLLGDVLVSKAKETNRVESVIVVDGVPQVGPNKIFSKVGSIVGEHYPCIENGQTKCYIFVEYGSLIYALKAVTLTNNYKLDKQHTLLVNVYTDFEKYEKISEKWEPPQSQAYKGQSDLHYYLLEPDAYDQFCVVKIGQSVQIWQNKTGSYFDRRSSGKFKEYYY